jgi:hypothetical protein
MDEMMWLRMFMGGGIGAGIDLSAVLAFIAFSVIYVLVPVLGYRPERPSGMISALYLLIGYGGLSLVQMLVQWVQMFDRPGGFGRGDGTLHLVLVFSALKMALFLLAMVMFAAGLRSLRLDERLPGPE